MGTGLKINAIIFNYLFHEFKSGFSFYFTFSSGTFCSMYDIGTVSVHISHNFFLLCRKVFIDLSRFFQIISRTFLSVTLSVHFILLHTHISNISNRLSSCFFIAHSCGSTVFQKRILTRFFLVDNFMFLNVNNDLLFVNVSFCW